MPPASIASRAFVAIGPIWSVDEAKATLNELDLPDRRRDALCLVADGVVERYA